MTECPAGLPEGAEPAPSGGFNQFIGPFYRLPDQEGGAVRRFCFVAEEKHMNAAGSVHGGMLMSFLDVAMSRSTRLATDAQRLSTVALTTDFVGPGRLGEVIEARVRVTRRTRTIVFLSAELVAAERILVTATGLWKIPAAP
ncbi:MAG: PaaI family thioesterase [Alphaproteobacteria bacterium]|nr:PaaI family thioesterase [Alphaproteobacteria bacterium]MBU6471447.1 PaaI family thioesterase [Alphaproteobacteria bacterium]